ncbi:MAG: N-acetyltransferase [Clostridiales Family XIII bacterium]|nr:N-acetyltransferase [Clostridiales Family XIII bacterium]
MKEVQSLLSTFSSRYDPDIEQFLKERAIDFSNRGIARTHLVMLRTVDTPILLGYFTLTNKILSIPCGAISKGIEKRLSRFGPLDENTDSYSVPMPLIAQIGKNYTNGVDAKISGDDLVGIALKRIGAIQFDLSGQYAYIECEDKPKLIEYYKRNGFIRIDNGEPSKLYNHGKPYLVQMLKHIS